jgi:hypothetical protein
MLTPEKPFWKIGRMTKKFLISLPAGSIIQSCVVQPKSGEPRIATTLSDTNKGEIWEQIKRRECNNRTFTVFKTSEDYQIYRRGKFTFLNKKFILIQEKRRLKISPKQPDPIKAKVTRPNLYWWFDTFNRRFFDDKLPFPEIMMVGGNSFVGRATWDESRYFQECLIEFNSSILGNKFGNYLPTLAHEMVHIYEFTTTQKVQTPQTIEKQSTRHSDFFFKKASEIGILVTDTGLNIAYSDPIVSYLRQHGHDILKNQKSPKRFSEALISKEWHCCLCGEQVEGIVYKTKL